MASRLAALHRHGTGTMDGSAPGVNGTVTIYDDPGYISVEVYGQTITLAVPESAPAYLAYLAYLAYAQ